mmetsp:Transcript_17435/g.20187  ORF Transcript_17435/g.20187 Transcript_17435/m.20187 type:complete len:1290 (-) Transcript_17435:102-3971(-)
MGDSSIKSSPTSTAPTSKSTSNNESIANVKDSVSNSTKTQESNVKGKEKHVVKKSSSAAVKGVGNANGNHGRKTNKSSHTKSSRNGKTTQKRNAKSSGNTATNPKDRDSKQKKAEDRGSTPKESKAVAGKSFAPGGKSGFDGLKSLFKRNGGMKYYQAVKDAGIDLNKFQSLNFDDLNEYGIPKGLRSKLLKDRDSSLKGKRSNRSAEERSKGKPKLDQQVDDVLINAIFGLRKGKESTAATLQFLQSIVSSKLNTAQQNLIASNGGIKEHVAKSKSFKLNSGAGTVVLSESAIKYMSKKSNATAKKISKPNPQLIKESKNKGKSPKPTQKNLEKGTKKDSIRNVILRELSSIDSSVEVVTVGSLVTKVGWDTNKGSLSNYLAKLRSDGVVLTRRSKEDGGDVCKLVQSSSNDSKMKGKVLPHEIPGKSSKKKAKLLSDEQVITIITRKIKENGGKVSISVLSGKSRKGLDWQGLAARTSMPEQSLSEYLSSKTNAFVVRRENNNPVVSLGPKPSKGRNLETSGRDAEERKLEKKTIREKSSDRKSVRKRSQNDRLSSHRNQILVRHLVSDIQQEDIMNYFAKFGQVKEIRWNTRDRDSNSKTCTVEFEDAEAVTLVRNSNTHAINGSSIEVKTLAVFNKSPVSDSHSTQRKDETAGSQSIKANHSGEIVPGVILCAQGIPHASTSSEIISTFARFGCYGMTRVEKKGLAFLYFEKRADGVAAMKEVSHLAGNVHSRINIGFASRQEGVPATLLKTSQEDPKNSVAKAAEAAKQRGGDHQSEAKEADDDVKIMGSDVIEGVNSVISAAENTRNEITELIRSVQLDRLVAAPSAHQPPGVTEIPLANAHLHSHQHPMSSIHQHQSVNPSQHQQWMDPLGFSNRATFGRDIMHTPAGTPFANIQQPFQQLQRPKQQMQSPSRTDQTAVPTTRSDGGSEASALGRKNVYEAGSREYSHTSSDGKKFHNQRMHQEQKKQFDEQKRQLDSFGTNMGSLVGGQLRMRKSSMEGNRSSPTLKKEMGERNGDVMIDSRRRIEEDETEESKSTKNGSSNPSSPVTSPSMKPRGKMMSQDSALDPFELQLPASAVKRKTGVLNNTTSMPKRAPKHNLQLTRDTGSNQNSTGLLNRTGVQNGTKRSGLGLNATTAKTTPKKFDLTTKGKKSTSWASQITKQIGVGPRLVSLKSSASRNSSTGIGTSAPTSIKTWGTAANQPKERPSLQMLQQQEEAAGRMQRQQRQMQMIKPKPSAFSQKSRNMSRLAASKEVANSEFPTLRSVQLAGQMGNSASNAYGR